MSALHRVLRQRSNGLQPLLSLKGKLDMLEAQLEIRRRLQTSTRAAHEVEADDERVIYVEDQDDDSQNDEEQATSASSRRKRRTTLSGTRQPSNGLGSLADGEESSEAMPTTMNGDMGSSEAGNDESESDSNDLMDDEAEETDDDSADERDDSVDHDDVSTEDDENEDDESELAMPPAKRFAGMSKTSNAPQQWR
jgi:U3 small nucleolar RNA-associated protein 5